MKRLYYKITNKKLIQVLEGIEVSQKAINQYQTYVKGNNQESMSLLSKKLRRNFMCGKRNRNTVEYGNLMINFKWYKMDNSIEIISIYNKRGRPTKLDINNKLKDKIDKLIGLDLFN